MDVMGGCAPTARTDHVRGAKANAASPALPSKYPYVCISLCTLAISDMLLYPRLSPWPCNRNYEDKLAYFDAKREDEKNGKSEAKTGKAAADEWMGMHTSAMAGMTSHRRELLRKRQARGDIAQGVSNDHLEERARQEATQLQCVQMLNDPPRLSAFAHLDHTISNLEHPEGSTYTYGYGDMRTFGGPSAARARANECGLDGAASFSVHSGARFNSSALATAVGSREIEEERRQIQIAIQANDNANKDAGFDKEQMNAAMSESLRVSSAPHRESIW